MRIWAPKLIGSGADKMEHTLVVRLRQKIKNEPRSMPLGMNKGLINIPYNLVLIEIHLHAPDIYQI